MARAAKSGSAASQGQGAPGPCQARGEDARDIERDESRGETLGGHDEGPAARGQDVAGGRGGEPRGGEEEGGGAGRPGAGGEQGVGCRAIQGSQSAKATRSTAARGAKRRTSGAEGAFPRVTLLSIRPVAPRVFRIQAKT